MIPYGKGYCNSAENGARTDYASMHAVRYLCDRVCSTEVYDTKTIITSYKLMNTCESTRARGVGWSGRLADDESILSLSLRARAGSSPKTRGRFLSARPPAREGSGGSIVLVR